MPASKHPSRKPRLSVAQVELVAQFADFSFDYRPVTAEAASSSLAVPAILPRQAGFGTKSKSQDAKYPG